MHLPSITVERDNAPILSDEKLHHLGELYLANPVLRLRGVLFETFIRFPTELLALVVYETIGAPALEIDVLAPDAQVKRLDVADEVRAIERTLDLEDPQTRLHGRGGALIEPLRHHRFYKPHRSYHNPQRLEAGR